MESRNPLQKDHDERPEEARRKLDAAQGDETQLSQKEADSLTDQPMRKEGQPGIEVPAYRADAGTVAAAQKEAQRTGEPLQAETRDLGAAPANRTAGATSTSSADTTGTGIPFTPQGASGSTVRAADATGDTPAGAKPGTVTAREVPTTADATRNAPVDPDEAKDPFIEHPGGPKSAARTKSQPGGIGKPERRRQGQFNEP